MKKRDIGILIGLGVVVLLVAWYFLIIGPKRDKLAETEKQLEQEQKTYEDNSAKIKRITEEKNAAQQTEGEIMKLDKLIPADAQVPSLIIELQQSAQEAGIEFMKIEPAEAVAGADGNTIIPFEMKFQGDFFDVNDFLYRVENYARMEGNDVNVSGRLLSVVEIILDEPDREPKFPQVMATLTVNAFMTGPPPAKPKAGESSGDASGSGGGNGGGSGGNAGAPSGS